MLKRAIAATAALAATVNAQVGNAVIVNSCDYPVYLQNTPAAGGGAQISDETLQPGDSYTQVWTSLTNGQGWSMKLSQVAGSFGDNVMQYEYTWGGFQPGQWEGILWYDLSDVNGNPWNENWMLTATGDCFPRQAAYRDSTDDAYGEQSCPVASSITVELCTGDNSAPAPEPLPSTTSAWSEEPSTPTTPAIVPTLTSFTAPPAPTTTGNTGYPHGWGAAVEENVAVGSSVATTLSTVARGGVTVTEVYTAIQTTYVTAAPSSTPTAAKRFEHFARHAHGHGVHRH